MLDDKDERERRQPVKLMEVFRYVWSYWRQAPWSVALITGGITAAVGFDIALPSVSRALVLAVSAGDHEQAFWLLGGFLGCGIGFAIFWQIGYRHLCRETVRLMQLATHDAFAKVQRASTDWHANTFAGSTVRKITRGIWAFDTFSDTVISGIVPTVVLVVGSLVVMTLQWPIMGIAATISFTLYVAGAVLMARYYIAPTNREANRQDSALSAALADSVTCNATVKVFGAEAAEDERLKGVTQRWAKASIKSWLRRQDLYAVMTALSLVNQMALLGTPLWLWSRGQAGPAEVAYAITAYFLLGGVIRNVVNFVQNLQKAVNELEDVVMLSHLPLGVEDAPSAKPATITRGEVRLEQVGFAYKGQSQPIYRNLSLTIKPGERVGLVGTSGSGKSTFVKLIQRLYDVTEGTVKVDGQDVRQLTQSSLRARIALVPQEPVLFHRSLLDNIRYARQRASVAEVVEAAKQAHAHGFISALPEGYDTLVGERGVKLSGGERQRVAIARAILADAPILILDEATSSLDSVSELLIQEALERLMIGRTTIVVAHRLSTIRAADRILVFERGRIVEDGPPAELLARADGHYRNLFETQALGLEQAN